MMAAPLALPAAEEISERDLNAALSSPDSFLRYNTWKKLNPEKESHYKILVQILRSLPWYDREGAIDSLRKAATSETIQKMVKDLKENKDPSVRQGMAVALAKMNDEKFYPHLYEALKDKNPQVRRMVVWSLRVQKKKEAVDALVDQFQNEKDPVVQSFLVDALNDLTQAYVGPTPAAWKSWWARAKVDPDYKLGQTDEESLKKAEELGLKLKSRQVTSVAGGVTLETEERGGNEKIVSVPILIIPYYGYSKEIMKPFLSELEKTNKLYYIDLPPIKSFGALKTAGATQIPFYPIDKLVEAFEDLRKETKQERFAIMACGMNSWIAMKYANLYPKSVSHMVLISPVSSYKAYSDALNRMESQGKAKNDIEMWHYALTQSFNNQTGESVHDIFHKEKNLPVPDGEDGGLDRRSWSLFFRDERDSLIAMLYPKKHRQMGTVAIPDYRCFSEKPKARIPTIVIVGKNCLYAGVEDCKQIAKHYGGECFVYENSSAMPFAEESTRFNKDMAALLRERKK